MKEYKHYISDCKNCKTYKACMEENYKTHCTNKYPYIPYKIYKAVNKTEIHYFDNEMNFVDFLRTHFGEYKAILPENYYENDKPTAGGISRGKEKTMIQVIYVNVDKGTKPQIKLIEDNIDTFYKLINCDSVEMPQRQINGKYFTIICDEEGRLKDNPIVSACSHKGEPMIVGNLIITGLPGEYGNLTGLSDDDVLLIMEKFKKTLLYHPLKSELKDGYILFCEY